MSGPLIDGLLVEGLNYSGKTTLAGKVVMELAARGAPVRAGHCYLCDDPQVVDLQRRSFEGIQPRPGADFPDASMLRPFNAYRSAQIMVDAQVAAERSWDDALLVQDRHWLSQFCNNEFFTPGEGFLSERWAAQHAPRFTIQLYMTCSQPIREQRMNQRPTAETHALNTYLRANVSEFQLFEDTCLQLIDRLGGFEIVDTDEIDLDHLARQLAGRLTREVAG